MHKMHNRTVQTLILYHSDLIENDKKNNHCVRMTSISDPNHEEWGAYFTYFLCLVICLSPRGFFFHSVEWTDYRARRGRRVRVICNMSSINLCRRNYRTFWEAALKLFPKFTLLGQSLHWIISILLSHRWLTNIFGTRTTCPANTQQTLGSCISVHTTFQLQNNPRQATHMPQSSLRH